MKFKHITQKYNTINKLLSSQQIAEALGNLKEFVELKPNDDFIFSLEKNKTTYEQILKYMLKGVDDPQRASIQIKLIKSLFELNDKIKEYHLEQINSELYTLKKEVKNRSKLILQKLKDIQKAKKLSDDIPELLSLLSDEEEKETNLFHKEFFYMLWLTDNLSEEEFELTKYYLTAENHEWYDRALIVSALGLSSMRYFCPLKIKLLIYITQKSVTQISERAFIGLMFSLYIYDNRLYLYPEILKEIKKLSVEQFVQFFIIQIIKAKDTEKFTKKFRDEIMPDIMKHAPDIQQKLDLDNILPDDTEEAQNPNWRKIIEQDHSLMDKLEELSKLQMEGTDVFMGTFAMLKNFPFFQHIHNWFIPFYKENEIVSEALDGENKEFKDTFLLALEKSGHMCNSDKYSFCLNVKILPDAQKKMMLNMFKQELESINEINEDDDMLNHTLISKRIITHHIQDIYRFFKLYSKKDEYDDIFSYKLDFHNKSFFRKYFQNKDILIKAVDFYFDNGHFEQAHDIYNILIEENVHTPIIFEKAGYTAQQMGLYKEAIELYKKSELFESTVWINLKIAHCCIKLGLYDEALIYFNEAGRQAPDDLKIQLHIANAYLSKGDAETALNYYYKLELLAASNIKVLRPISWCLFVMGRFEEAEKYFTTLLNSQQANKYDLMNYAHLLWCKGNTEEACNYYLKSIKQKDNSLDDFLKSLSLDKKYLIAFGIKEEDILNMIEYIKILMN